MVYAIFGVLVIFYIGLLVMCWKTWRVTHIISTFFVYAAAVTFVVFAALVLKTQANWHALYVKYDKAVANAEKERERLLKGDPLTLDQKADTVRSLTARLDNVKLRRGRVWRTCTYAGAVDAETLKINMATANVDPKKAPTEKPPPHGIKEKLPLYVFAEGDPVVEGMKSPVAFIGFFIAKDISEAEITMSPLLPSDEEQMKRIQASEVNQTTWTMYELIPLDGYELFATEDTQVGMDKEELKKYIPKSPLWPDAEYEKFLDAFARFNQPAADDDPPENVWVEVKFLKEHTIPVDADAEQPVQDSPSYFDSQGRALVRPLRGGGEKPGEVKFVKDDTTFFDQATAKQLTDQGFCEPVKRVYRRQLHDYSHFFHELNHRHLELDDSIRRAKRDAAEMVALAAKAKEQQTYHEVEKIQLLKELGRFRQEKDEATARRVSLETQWAGFVQQLSQYYWRNLELNAELTKLQYEMANQINQRAAGAVTAQPPAEATH